MATPRAWLSDLDWKILVRVGINNCMDLLPCMEIDIAWRCVGAQLSSSSRMSMLRMRNLLPSMEINFAREFNGSESSLIRWVDTPRPGTLLICMEIDIICEFHIA